MRSQPTGLLPHSTLHWHQRLHLDKTDQLRRVDLDVLKMQLEVPEDQAPVSQTRAKAAHAAPTLPGTLAYHIARGTSKRSKDDYP